jgi:cytochrome oxidase Cu insertion factor (SCO1/SenC/PrrC family)
VGTAAGGCRRRSRALRVTLRAVGVGALLVATFLPVSAADRNLRSLLIDLDVAPLDGRTPSAFSLNGLDGARLSLADLRGRAVLLYFWATW